MLSLFFFFFFFSSRRRHTRFSRDWSSDVCSSDLERGNARFGRPGCGECRERLTAAATEREVCEQTPGLRRSRDRWRSRNERRKRELEGETGIEADDHGVEQRREIRFDCRRSEDAGEPERADD